jgi:hypothetical protein
MLARLRGGGGVQELRAFVPRFVCRACRVPPAGNSRVTAKRILSAVGRGGDEVEEVVAQSQAIRGLVRMIARKTVPKKVLAFLELANTSLVPTPALQNLADFPEARVSRKRCGKEW